MWSAGMATSGLVLDLEEDAVPKATTAAKIAMEAAKKSRLSFPPSPSTPFFGKGSEAAASHRDGQELRPPETSKSAVGDACFRALHELRRNNSLLRLMHEEEVSRLGSRSPDH